MLFEHALENFVEWFAHERSQDPIDAVNALSAVLAAGDLRNDLRRYRTGNLERFRRIDLLAVDNGTVGEHVFQIDQAAVKHRLDDVVHVMEMNRAAVVCLHNIRGNQFAAGDIFRDFAGDQITLRRNNMRVFIRVFIQDSNIAFI